MSSFLKDTNWELEGLASRKPLAESVISSLTLLWTSMDRKIHDLNKREEGRRALEVDLLTACQILRPGTSKILLATPYSFHIAPGDSTQMIVHR